MNYKQIVYERNSLLVYPMRMTDFSQFSFTKVLFPGLVDTQDDQYHATFEDIRQFDLDSNHRGRPYGGCPRYGPN
jgi:hypothetical protein